MSIVSTVFGIVILSNAEQVLNAERPIVIKLSGSVIEFNEEHP